MSVLTRSDANARRLQAVTGRKRLGLTVAAMVETWLERRRQRRALLELSDHMLKDVGLSRLDAYREGRKAFFFEVVKSATSRVGL